MKPALCFIFRRQAAGFLIAIFGSGYNKFRIGSEKKLKMKQSVAHLFWAVLLTGLLSLSLVLGACGETATPATSAVATSLPATTLSNTTAAATTTTVATSVATTTAATTTAAITTAATTSVATTSALTTAATTTAAMTTNAATTTAASMTTVATTSGTSATNTTYPLTMTDDNKRTITLPKAPTKIVSLAPSNTEILFALGLNDKIVGVDQFSDYPEAAKAIKKIGGFSDTNIEAVTALAPDLVLASLSIQSKAQIAALEKQNFTVLILNPSDLAGVVQDFKLVGQATNTNDKAQTLAADFQKRLDAVATKFKSASAKPTVYFELDPTLYTVAPGSFVDDMIQKAGGQNIVTDASNPYPQLTQEVVVAKSPQVIFVGDDTSGTDTPDKIMARPGWNTIAAVKNKRVYAINADLTNRPGPRAVDGVEQVAKFLYPDLFK